ncbi:hypothetical protein ACBP45_03175 [Latilactobacillus sakei]
MAKKQDLFKEVINIQELSQIKGGWNSGPAEIWNGIMNWAGYSCNWGNMYGSGHSSGGRHGYGCTSH